jgi:hypothetical protein
MTRKPTLNVTVSGSFRRAMSAVQDAVYRLTDAGALVLSPADPRVVDEFGEFLFVASDRVRAIRLVQSRHLAAIKEVVRIVVELRGGDPVNELSQTAETATSGAGVEGVV